MVKIYTKSDVLSTGAVLVDLPGVHDSNAARAAVAQNYMKLCSGLWIVAPITRAVDDKAAKTLLGDSFKRQLKYDGIYSAVTFICSKTDDSSITEAVDSLGMAEQVALKHEVLYTLEREKKRLMTIADDLRAARTALREKHDNMDDELEQWESLQGNLELGETVYALAGSSKKRKRSAIDDEGIDEPTSDSEGTHLTEDAVEDKISELKKQRKAARRERKDLDEQIKDANAAVKNHSKFEPSSPHLCEHPDV